MFDTAVNPFEPQRKANSCPTAYTLFNDSIQKGRMSISKLSETGESQKIYCSNFSTMDLRILLIVAHLRGTHISTSIF